MRLEVDGLELAAATLTDLLTRYEVLVKYKDGNIAYINATPYVDTNEQTVVKGTWQAVALKDNHPKGWKPNTGTAEFIIDELVKLDINVVIIGER